MRRDMSKVVVERPRYGSSIPSRKWSGRIAAEPGSDYDDQPKFAPGGRVRQYGYEHRRFTDVLGPLRRFLRSNLGRPWNKVYSELCENLDRRKVTGQHIFDHLRSEVATDCFEGQDRKVYQVRWNTDEVEGFYVHPRTGLLLFAPRKSKREWKKEKLLAQAMNEVKLDREHSYRLIDENWFLVTYRWFEGGRDKKRNPMVYDIVCRDRVRLNWGANRIAVAKRSCNHDEIVTIRERIADWEKRVRRM